MHIFLVSIRSGVLVKYILNMFCKVLCAALLVASAQAIQYDHHAALSTVNFNDHHNSIHHIQSAPVHAAPVHAAPAVHFAAPIHHVPAPFHAIKVAPVHEIKAAPVVAIPVHKPAPAHEASSFTSISLHNSHAAPAPIAHAAPVHYATPAAHFAPAVHAASAVHAAPVVHASSHHVEEYSHPKYQFAYGVEDHHTGDIHSHKESRDGDVTHGEYSLHEADGTIRTVKYTVDKHSGFNAVVERTGHAIHAQPSHQSHHH